MTDNKERFLKEVEQHPDTVYTVYFGTKAAPLTKAHEAIIRYLVEDMVDRYPNVHLRIGVLDSDWGRIGTNEDIGNPLFGLVREYVDATYPGHKGTPDDWVGRKIEVVVQFSGEPLYDFLKGEYPPDRTLVVLGEDEWKSLDAGDSGGWKRHEEMKREYMLHLAKARSDGISATAAREALYQDPLCMYCQVSKHISKWVFDYVKEHELFWQLAPNYRAQENLFLKNYDASRFPRPSVTVDNIAWTEDEHRNRKVLLIRRRGHPYKNFWALPGGFLDVDMDKTLRDAARRELQEETNLKNLPDSIQFRTYGDMGTDPRTRVVDVVYATKLPKDWQHSAFAGDDASDVALFPLDELPRLAFNHEQILKEYFKEH